MQMLSLIPLSGILLLFAAGLMVWHVQSWRSVRQSDIEPHELGYRRGQFQRRLLTTSLMALVAIALPFTVWIIERWPRAGAAYVIVMLLMLVVIGLLALADIFSIRLFYGRLRDQHQLDQARLAAEIRRAETARPTANGSAFTKPSGNGNGAVGPGREANP